MGILVIMLSKCNETGNLEKIGAQVVVVAGWRNFAKTRLAKIRKNQAGENSRNIWVAKIRKNQVGENSRWERVERNFAPTIVGRENSPRV